MSDRELHIINTSLLLFGKFGIKTISMDEVAIKCGISKNTLYNSFKNKDELLAKVIDTWTTDLEQQLKTLRAGSANAIDEVFLYSPVIQKVFETINFRMVAELEKYNYVLWQKIKAFHQVLLQEFILKNLKRGQEEVLFHHDFNRNIIGTMRLQQIIQLHSAIDVSVPFITLPRVLQELTRHYLSGVATPAGQEEMKNRSVKYNSKRSFIN